MYTGMKASMADWREKSDADPDFFELILQQTDEYGGSSLKALERTGVPWFGHLPTSFGGEDERILMNIASSDMAIREQSRSIINDLIRITSDNANPAGWILHAPTSWNFSTKRSLFSKGGDGELRDAMDWVSSLHKKVFIENVPPAILWKGEIYFTDPFAFEAEHPLLDTGHLYAHTQSNTSFLTQILERVKKTTYWHLATLVKNQPYDVHGKIFAAKEQEYPDAHLLRKTLSAISNVQHESQRDMYIVCEPGGDTNLHVRNLQRLRKELNALTHGGT